MIYQNIKTLLTVGAIAGTLLFAGCKKDKSASEAGADTGSAPAPAAVELNGTPAGNMVTVFELGVMALKNNSADPVAAATALTQVAATYNIADLREKSRAAKAAGQGATPEEKAKYKALTEEYKSLAETVGGANSAAFNPAHTAWSKAWGLN